MERLTKPDEKLKRVLIRLAREDELLEVFAIETKTNPYPWTDKMLLSSFYDHDFFVLDIPHSEGIQGYVISQSVCDEVSVLHILVSKSHQAKGYGRLLLKAWLKQLSVGVNTIWLEVRESNIAAQKLYLSCGFNQVSQRKNYYKTVQGQAKETALIYRLDL